jgi:hypothetical protein
MILLNNEAGQIECLDLDDLPADLAAAGPNHPQAMMKFTTRKQA